MTRLTTPSDQGRTLSLRGYRNSDKETGDEAVMQSMQKSNAGKALLPLLLVVLSAVSVAVTGYRGEFGPNHPLQLVVVKRILNPASYPNDAFADTSFAYASGFWYVVAFMSQMGDIRWVLAVLFVVAKGLLIYSAFRVGQALFPTSIVAATACAVLVATPSSLYSPGNLSQGATEQTIFAVSFLFLSLAASLRGEWWKWAMCMGIVANLNFIYFMYGLSYYGAAWLLWKRRKYKQFVMPVVTTLLTSLPAVYLLLRAARQPVEDRTAPWMVAELTFPLYFFPNTIGTLWHGILALFFVLALTLPYLRGLPLSPMAARTLQIWAIVAAGWYGLAWATPFWIQSLPLLQIHLIRATDLWYFSMSFLVAGLTALAVVSTASDCFWRRALWGLALIGSSLWPYLLSSTWKLIGLVLIAVPIAGELAWQVLKRLPPLQGERQWSGYYLTILFIGGALVGIHAMRERFYTFGHPLFIRYPTVETVAQWARENTAEDATFLVPVHGEWRYFRYFSDRSVFVHQKDGDAFPYAPWYAAEWLRRMAQLGLFEVAGIDPQHYTIGEWVSVGGSEWMRPRLNYYEAVSKRITEARVAHLAQEYRIDYWITYKDTETNYPEVYAHGKWKVVRVTDLGDRQ